MYSLFLHIIYGYFLNSVENARKRFKEKSHDFQSYIYNTLPNTPIYIEIDVTRKMYKTASKAQQLLK